jgi:hypothetical protein
VSVTLTQLARRAYSKARLNPVVRRLLTVPGVRRSAVALRDGLKTGVRSFRAGGLSPVAIPPSVPSTVVAESVSPPVAAAPPVPAQSPYEVWFSDRLKTRRREYPYQPEPGLLSFFSPAWNTPPQYLRALFDSFDTQCGQVPFEWVIVDNGTDAPATLEVLAELAQVPWIRIVRVFPNIGIGRAMRRGLEECRGRYVCPVDSDDLLLPDAALIVTSMIQRSNYPAFLFSDEDHVAGDRLTAPYHKPGWDPVLGVNSGYTAHLEVIHRETALSLGVYPGSSVDGSTDWDTTLRFANAGHKLVHIPEMLYHWREHPGSTAADISCKSYIFDSQRAVLSHWLAAQPHAERFDLQLSPLFPGTPDWWIRRRPVAPEPLAAFLFLPHDSDPASFAEREAALRATTDYPRLEVVRASAGWSAAELGRALDALDPACRRVALLSGSVSPTRPDWAWEAIGLFELFPELAQVGGRVHNADGYVVECGRVFGYGDDLLGCPDRGRPLHDCGYYAQMFKPHCSDGIASRFCVFDRDFLREVLRSPSANRRGMYLLGHWAAAAARRAGRRVAYTPFIAGCDVGIWQELAPADEVREFAAQAGDLVTGSTNYPGVFGLTPETAYTPVRPEVRRQQLARLGFDPPATSTASPIRSASARAA